MVVRTAEGKDGDVPVCLCGDLRWSVNGQSLDVTDWIACTHTLTHTWSF